MTNNDKLYARKVKRDAQGYDQGGAYWGAGDTLYVVFTANHDFIFYVWCPTRKEALRAVEEKLKVEYGV